jgi:hypothetical protein
MEPDFKNLSLDEIKAKMNATPKAIPVTTLDFAAMHAAIDRFQAETQQRELREWLIYQAPPGVYDMYIEERKRLQKEDEQQNRIANRFTGVIVLSIIGYTVWTLWTVSHIGVPR